jgi:hypothetical protein
MTNREIRDQEITILIHNQCFVHWLLGSLDWKWKLSIYNPITQGELEEEARVALAMGYNKALMYRYLEYMELITWDDQVGWWDESWLDTMRKTVLFHGKDHRINDFSNIRKMFPELDTWYPEEDQGISIEEVLECAKRELSDMLFGPGTTYREQRFLANEGKSKRHSITDLHTYSLAHGKNPYVYLPDGSREFVDCSTDSEHNVPGPSKTMVTVGAHMLERYGPRPMIYWLWEKMYYPRKYTKLIYLLGGDNAPVRDSQDHRALKRDVRLKIPRLDREAVVLAENYDLQDHYFDV